MDLNAFRLNQCIPEFEQRDIGILRDQFFEERLMRRQFAMPSGAPLGQRSGMTPDPDCPRPSRDPVAGESFSSNAAARLLNLSSIQR